MTLEYQRKEFEALLKSGDKDQAVTFLTNLGENIGYKKTIKDILEPTMIKWGKLWMHGKISLADGYLSGKVAEEVFLKASTTPEFSDTENTENKGTIVIGNAEDDFHPLGRRLVVIFAKAAGWEIVDLGNDVIADEFINAALEHNASIIAVSAMMYTTASNIIKIRHGLDKMNLENRIKLAVGGAVFKLNPELVNEVGGDGTTENAISAPDLFSSLQAQLNTNT